jgi:Mg/Co/Ni transporter MgtE
MSPRAAWRLEHLGFREVYDFVHGKSFWLAHGLATDGTSASASRAGAATEHDVPTCRLGETVATALERIAAHRGPGRSWDLCIVTNGDGIVAGRVRRRALETAPDTRVDAIMEPGPATIRPDTGLVNITQRMSDRGVASVIVTDPSGRLIGVMRRPREG